MKSHRDSTVRTAVLSALQQLNPDLDVEALPDGQLLGSPPVNLDSLDFAELILDVTDRLHVNVKADEPFEDMATIGGLIQRLTAIYCLTEDFPQRPTIREA